MVAIQMQMLGSIGPQNSRSVRKDCSLTRYGCILGGGMSGQWDSVCPMAETSPLMSLVPYMKPSGFVRRRKSRLRTIINAKRLERSSDKNANPKDRQRRHRPGE